MTTIEFTSNIQRHVKAPVLSVEAATVGEALKLYFAKYPEVRPYLLDNQGALRQHMLVLVDGIAIADRSRQNDSLKPGSDIFVFQALSGG